MASIDERDRMRALIRKWRSSGQTKTEFVRRHGLSRGKLEYWVRRLGEESGPGRRGRGQEPLSLIPVQVTERASGLSGEIEILLSGGDRVRVSPAVPAEALRRVVEVLRGGC
jgi:transposase-like protein